MEFQKIINLLDTTFDNKDLPRFVTKKWIEIYDQSENNYSINKEIRIKTKNCVLADMTAANNPPTRLEFQIKDTKLYVPAVTLSKENDIKFSEKLKLGFKKIIKWNKYRSQMTIQNINNNLNYLIDPKFTNVNRLF